MLTACTGTGATGNLNVLELTWGCTTHTASLVITHRTASPFKRPRTVKPVESWPTGSPFTNHWYCGPVPPSFDVAVKVTGNPIHTVDNEPAIETPASGFGTTDIDIGFEKTSQLTVPRLPVCATTSRYK